MIEYDPELINEMDLGGTVFRAHRPGSLDYNIGVQVDAGVVDGFIYLDLNDIKKLREWLDFSFPVKPSVVDADLWSVAKDPEPVPHGERQVELLERIVELLEEQRVQSTRPVFNIHNTDLKGD